MEFLFRRRDEYDDSTALVRFQGEDMEEVVSRFREFLLGCGFANSLVDRYVPDPGGEMDTFGNIDFGDRMPDSEGGEE